MSSAKEITDISDDDDFKTEDPTFTHQLPTGAILVRIADNVNVDDRAAEISNKRFRMFKELQIQMAGLLRMVGLDLEDDDGVDD
ncbi:hypothetical protein GGX14DRAFT_558086 [Mycena pura]|uniref:Uncharacterized protein n=1 Tax=Mycena pura TaxID=153505 RepID=A0AAD6YMP3_9AGAR|nr:hypothetical protein GGX14DRAFT_558086 [Mycena pura]